MIKVGGFDYKTGAAPQEPGYLTVIVQPGKKYHYGPLSPYAVKDKHGHWIENAYQFRKLYPDVGKQNQWTYVEGYQGKQNTWLHPAEQHVSENQILPAYWQWRLKGLNNEFAIRYPNGFHGRHKCLYLIDDDGNFLDYLHGRKVYVNAYLESNIREHPLYQELQQLHQQGCGLIICEVDGPRYHESEPFNNLPQNVEGCSLPVTKETVEKARWNTARPFGHGWVLAAMLAGLESEM